jgi:O-antigen ligase
MSNAGALEREHAEPSLSSGSFVESLGMSAIFGVAAVTQFSIFGETLLYIAALCWLALVIARHERIEVPTFFYPLLAYAGWTLLSACFSSDPVTSLIDCKQLSLFVLVPATVRLVPGSRRASVLTVLMSAGAAAAAIGIFQYGLLHYNQLSQRPHGTLGHYMTYSGLLLLVIGAALAKLLFDRSERLWPALIMPALVMAVALTSTRMAWVGVCTAATVLLILKDFRLLAILPLAGAITFAAAGPSISHRLMSMFDAKDPTRRDRVAMLIEGAHMVRDHPLFGVGPNMVQRVYEQYRVPEAVERINPHLHNVPVQIAAERGLPALAIWLTFIGTLTRDLYRRFRIARVKTLPAAAVAALVGMLSAGLFEYNFGDSEFLILFLLIITLPFVSGGAEDAAPARDLAPVSP